MNLTPFLVPRGARPGALYDAGGEYRRDVQATMFHSSHQVTRVAAGFPQWSACA
ncbi:MAG TPA: hypothetical protein VFX04_07335 [Rhodanobacteraceae bacterium]|nr:hypothetical protein [Rhodanobacteraceae bacterium]